MADSSIRIKLADDCTINVTTGIIEISKKSHILSYPEFKLLEYLIEMNGAFCQTKDILTHIWGDNEKKDDVYVRTTVNKLRNIHPAIREAIVNQPGRGYAFLYSRQAESEPVLFPSDDPHTYTPNPEELRRLEVQAQFSRKLSERLIKQAHSYLGKSKDLVALDIGCSCGVLTEQVLTNDAGFCKVIGVDIDEDLINSANKTANDTYSYYQADVMSEAFPERLREIMEEQGIQDGFDVIYCAFIIHLLDKPSFLLRVLNDFLSKSGVIILIGVDDGGQLFHYWSDGDDKNSELVNQITELTVSTRGSSYRYAGRRFYKFLTDAGFKNISSDYYVWDNVNGGQDYLSALYDFQFSFRPKYLLRAIENHPEDVNQREIGKKLLFSIERLKTIFQNAGHDFYYMVVSFGFIAQRFY